MKLKDRTNRALPVFCLLVLACTALTFCSGCANVAATQKWQARLAPDSLASETLIGWLKDKGVVTQKTVDNIHKAAAFAARITYTPDPK